MVASRQVQIAKPGADSGSSEGTEEEVVRGEIETTEEEEEMEVQNLGRDFSSSDDEMLLTTTRSGRVAASWRNAFLKYN